ncbi:hypothetical protein BD414DRAFT_480697 [Trametes punicea]|nr:hypothetical protein BD414DRAFT_480697 [Trametes punicea]
MSLSTTTTATYGLVKYSRAYGHNPNAPSDQSELQWQHFVNPVIQLTMDTRRSTEGQLESYRLKIIWMFSSGPNSMDLDQREVIFEDLDLVTYSTMPSLQPSQGMPLKAVFQGAIVGLRYQHPRVTPAGATPQYRRFQVAFQDAASASAFIDSIRFICPCKANAPPLPAPRAPPAQSRPGAAQAASQQLLPAAVRSAWQPSVSSMSVDDPHASVRRTETSLPPFSSLTTHTPDWNASQDFHPAPFPASSAVRSCLTGSATALQSDDRAYGSSRPSSAVTASSAVAHHSSSDFSSSANIPPPTRWHTHARPAASTPVHSASEPTPAPPAERVPDLARPQQIHPSAPSLTHNSVSSDTSLPSSSFPHSSSSPPPMAPARPSSPDLMPPPPPPPPSLQSSQISAISSVSPAVPRAPPALPSTGPTTTRAEERPGDSIPSEAPSNAAASSITAALRDSAGLYDLPAEDLERLVAEVVREDGFADLMTALDGMWKVKGLVGIV